MADLDDIKSELENIHFDLLELHGAQEKTNKLLIELIQAVREQQSGR